MFALQRSIHYHSVHSCGWHCDRLPCPILMTLMWSFVIAWLVMQTCDCLSAIYSHGEFTVACHCLFLCTLVATCFLLFVLQLCGRWQSHVSHCAVLTARHSFSADLWLLAIADISFVMCDRSQSLSVMHCCDRSLVILWVGGDRLQTLIRIHSCVIHIAYQWWLVAALFFWIVLIAWQ